jgi:hypothetical protein
VQAGGDAVFGSWLHGGARGAMSCSRESVCLPSPASCLGKAGHLMFEQSRLKRQYCSASLFPAWVVPLHALAAAAQRQELLTCCLGSALAPVHLGYLIGPQVFCTYSYVDPVTMPVLVCVCT